MKIRNMTKQRFIKAAVFALPFVAVLVFGMRRSASPAFAADPCPAGFTILPNQINSGFGVRLTAIGSGFSMDSWVDIEGSGIGRIDPVDSDSSYPTQFVFDLPTGIDRGRYDVTIHEVSGLGSGTSCTIDNALRVVTPETPDLGLDEDEEDPTSTPLPTTFIRPLVLVPSYGASSAVLVPGQNVEVQVNLRNDGQRAALNVIATFIEGEGDFQPRITGGVLADTRMEVGEFTSINQILKVNPDLIGETATMEMTLEYTDEFGNAYEESFLLVLDLNDAINTGATATPTLTPNSQLVITSYEISVGQLQPGTTFQLDMTVQNQGESSADSVTMIIGGGGSGSTSLDDTSTSGGVSGSAGTFDNFAPIGSSNVQRIGDLASGGRTIVSQQLVVNVSTQPGAYPLPVSFVYTNEDGESVTDDQVITMLVYSSPQIEVNFYRPLDPLFVGQPGALPLQVVNLGRSSVTLGTMLITADNGTVENGETLIGSLDTGGFFTFDSTVSPDKPGQIQIDVVINYTDDFNEPQSIIKTFNLEVMGDDPLFEGALDGQSGGFPLEETGSRQPETFGQIVFRFIRGLFGLDSARPEPEAESLEDGSTPFDGQPPPGE